MGVAVGGVALFAIGFFSSRQCKKRGEFKVMKVSLVLCYTLTGSTGKYYFTDLGRTGQSFVFIRTDVLSHLDVFV